MFIALGPRKSLFGPVSQQPATKGRPVTYGSGFVATASEAGGPGECFSHNLKSQVRNTQ